MKSEKFIRNRTALITLIAASLVVLISLGVRQTFGMSELGIVRVKSESRDSLFMKIGGEGVEIKIDNNVLMIRSETRMIGYLNAKSPFLNRKIPFL